MAEDNAYQEEDWLDAAQTLRPEFQPPFLLHSQLSWQRDQSVIQQILLEHLLRARQF